MFKVGDKVKLVKLVKIDVVEPGAILTIKDIDSFGLCTFEELKPFTKWQGIGIEGRNVEVEHKIPQAFLELVKPEKEKTNIIKRVRASNDSVITYDVNNREISFNVKGKIHLTTLLKILLHETELYNYKYERISPFKFKREYVSEDMQHKWWIEFIDIKSFENISQEIIRCDSNVCFEGSCKTFIPDFLELCVERKLLRRVYDGYELIKRLDKAMNHCEYINGKPSVKELKSKGYIIPNQYIKLIEKEGYSLKA